MKEKIHNFIKKVIGNFLNESKVASSSSPVGYYTIANALDPEGFFKELNALGIKYEHDRYANVITVFVSDNKEASAARDLALSDIFEADDISEDDLPYMTPEEIGDAMEIRLK